MTGLGVAEPPPWPLGPPSKSKMGVAKTTPRALGVARRNAPYKNQYFYKRLVQSHNHKKDNNFLQNK
jgi:hypothetical protein